MGSGNRPVASSVALIAWCVAVLVVNAIALAVSVARRWPAAFGVTPDPNHITLGSGSAIAAPVEPLAAVAVCVILVVLPWRWVRVVGSVAATLLGVVFLVGNLGEPTTFHPEAALEAFFHVVGIGLALGLLGLGVWNSAANLRGERPSAPPR